MDRAIVLSVLLLLGLTWLLYKLAVFLEPRGGKSSNEVVSSVGNSRQKLIHRRLRK